MNQQEKIQIKWKQLIKAILLSILAIVIWSIYEVESSHFILSSYMGLNVHFIILAILVINLIAIPYYLIKSKLPTIIIKSLHAELLSIKPLSIGSKIILFIYTMWILSAVFYLIISRNYRYIILLYCTPPLLLPILLRLLPSVRKDLSVNKYFSKFISENEEFSFFYITLLTSTIWLGCIWAGYIIDANNDRKITLTLQSITASIAPLAFYIAWKNYNRKSGVKFIVKLKNGTSLVYPDYIKEIVFLNEKDRSNIILKMYITFDNQYINKLRHNESNSIIKAYDAHTFTCPPFTYYTAIDSSFSKSIDTKILHMESIMTKEKTIIIETTQGWYQSNKFLEFQDNIVINNNISKPNFPIYLSGTWNIGHFSTSSNQQMKLILPSDFIALIILEDDNQSILWTYVYDEHSNEAKVFKVQLNNDLNIFYIDSKLLKAPDFPYDNILDRIAKEYLQNKNSLDEWKNDMKNKNIQIDMNKVHIITPSFYDKHHKKLSCVVSD